MTLRRPVWVLYVLSWGWRSTTSSCRSFGVRVCAATSCRRSPRGRTSCCSSRSRRLVGPARPPSRTYAVDWLALAFAGFVVVYAVLPQSWLGGARRTRACSTRPGTSCCRSGAYFLGRGLDLTSEERGPLPRGARSRRLRRGLRPRGRLPRAALVVARPVAGLVLRPARADYAGCAASPRTSSTTRGGERRLPAARRRRSSHRWRRAYLLGVAMLFVAAARPPLGLAARSPALCGAPVDAHARGAARARARAARPRRGAAQRRSSAALAVAVAVVAFVFVQAYDHIGPRTHFTKSELVYQEQQRTSAGRATTRRVRTRRRPGAPVELPGRRATVAAHPQGFGLGNSGSRPRGRT